MVPGGDRSIGLARRRRDRRESERRRRRRRVLLALAVGWLGLTTWSLVAAYGASRAAMQDLRALQEDLGALSSADLTSVATDLDRVSRRLRDPWVMPLRVIPFLGRQLTVPDAMALSAKRTLQTGATALDSVGQLEVGTLSDSVSLARLELEAARRELEGVRVPTGHFLFGPVGEARDDFERTIESIRTRLDRYSGLALGIERLLNQDGRYLIAAANTSEMGSASGMLLQYGEVTIQGGELQLSDFVSAGEIGRPQKVAIAEEITHLWYALDPGHKWHYTSHLSSRGSSVARLTAAMWNSIHDDPVDGVIIISPVAMQELLVAVDSGEIVVGDGAIAPDQIADFFAYDQYTTFVGDDGDYDNVVARRDALAPVAARAVETLFGRSIDARRSTEALLDLFDRRHLMLWSADPETQRAWELAGAAGDPAANSIKVAVVNAGGNKLDQFLDTRVTVEAKRGQLSLNVRLSNRSNQNDVTYVAGAERPGFYSGYLVVNVPSAATDLIATGTTSLNASGADGATHSLVFIVELGSGESGSWNVRLALPDGFRQLVIEPSARHPPTTWLVNQQERADVRSTISLG